VNLAFAGLLVLVFVFVFFCGVSVVFLCFFGGVSRGVFAGCGVVPAVALVPVDVLKVPHAILGLRTKRPFDPPPIPPHFALDKGTPGGSQIEPMNKR
jgi:hypothetical protein